MIQLPRQSPVAKVPHTYYVVYFKFPENYR